MNQQKSPTATGQSVPFFGKMNYILMLSGIVIMALGYLLMTGGKTTDPNVFNPDEIYSFRRVTLAPVLVIIGLVVEIFAIFYRPKNQ